MEDAYEEGYSAFCSGDTDDLNPYDVNDAQHEDWLHGWEDAEHYEE